MVQTLPCRLHLLPAAAASVVAVIRRKPSSQFHVLAWDTSNDSLTPGSWFRGKLYPLRCDLSFDGSWLVYLAMGSTGETWNGVCRLPWLKTTLDAPNTGTWFGGGFWASPGELQLNGWRPMDDRATRSLPFRVRTFQSAFGEDEGVLYPRLERDGWRREGQQGRLEELRNARKYTVRCHDDPGWSWSFSPAHPTLRMFFLGYLDHGRTFRFALDGHPKLLDHQVTWATWDALGQLIVARSGGIERYTLDDLKRGTPGFARSLNHLEPPRRSTPRE